MGEHFGAFVVGREEPHDLAVTRAAIEVVVAVEDHILRPLYLAEADIFRLRQPVVQRIGRA